MLILQLFRIVKQNKRSARWKRCFFKTPSFARAKPTEESLAWQGRKS